MKNDNSLLWKYAGFATQLLVALALAVYIGLKADHLMHLRMPLAVWLLPLAVIIGLIWKAVKDTSQKK